MNLMVKSKTAFIGLGANLGNRLANLSDAIDKFHRHSLITVLAVSPLYQTKAHTLNPIDKAPDYFNAVIKIKTSLTPQDLLHFCLETEKSAGRRRKDLPQWAPRTLDLDILWIDHLVLNLTTLTLPHPRLHLRKFVLLPLFDIAPTQIIIANFTVSELLKKCPDLDLPKVVSDTATNTWPPILS